MPEPTLFNCIDAVEGNGAFLFSDTEKLFANSFLVLMKDTPYTKIAVKEITGLSGKSRTMFYQHFSDTLDLMDRIQRLLLEKLHLYVVPEGATKEENVTRAYEGMVAWFKKVLALRPVLRIVIGENGSSYFKDRLASQIRQELNHMMDDDRAPNDRMRPYYVYSSAASYIGLLTYLATTEDDAELLDINEMVKIANSLRVSYYLSDKNAPKIDSLQLFGYSE